MSETKTHPSSRRQFSFVWPMVLITIGTLLLLQNLGWIQGDLWSLVVVYWPVLLLLGGLEGALNRDGFVVSLVFAAGGGLMLLGNLGLLSMNAFELAAALWPMLLVGLGLDFVTGRRTWLSALVGVGTAGLMVAGVIWWSGARAGAATLPGEQVRQPVAAATSATIQLDGAAGRMRLDALPEPGLLISGSVPQSAGADVRQEYSLDGDHARLELRQNGVALWTPGFSADRQEWRLGFAPDFPLTLSVGLGAGEIWADLSRLALEQGRFSIGVGQLDLIVPAVNGARIEASAAIGQVTITVPAGVGVRLKASTALGGESLPAGWTREGEYHFSPGYDSAEIKLDVEASVAIGAVRVR